MRRLRGTGAMNARITLQREVQVADGGGGGYHAWSTVKTIWAEIIEQSGSERIHADQLQSEVGTTIRIRHRTNVHAGMRVIEGEPDTADEPAGGGRVWIIEAVTDPEGRRIYLDLRCRSGARS